LVVGRRISRGCGPWWRRCMARTPPQYSCGVRRTRTGAAATPRGDGGAHMRDGETHTAAGGDGESAARVRRRRLEQVSPPFRSGVPPSLLNPRSRRSKGIRSRGTRWCRLRRGHPRRLPLRAQAAHGGSTAREVAAGHSGAWSTEGQLPCSLRRRCSFLPTCTFYNLLPL
jgi:hypothetical protein